MTCDGEQLRVEVDKLRDFQRDFEARKKEQGIDRDIGGRFDYQGVESLARMPSLRSTAFGVYVEVDRLF